MKYIKYFLLLIIFAFAIQVSANVNQENQNSQDMYCPKEPYNLTNALSRGFQNVLGMNLIASVAASSILEDTIRSFAQGDINVKVNSISATDAKAGRFKNFTVTGNDIDFYSIYISKLKAKSTCNFIYLDLKKNPVELLEPMTIDFEAEFTEDDLNNMLKTTTYNKYLLTLKYDLITYKLMELDRPKISLKDDKFHFEVKVRLPFNKSFTLKSKTALKITDNKIHIEKPSKATAEHYKYVEVGNALLNTLTPLSFAQEVLKEHNCKLLLKDVKIKKEKVIVTGSVFLNRN